jgi:hypothetical protein
LNPTWVEWLMGFPTEFSACTPSEMRSSRKSRRSSDELEDQIRATRSERTAIERAYCAANDYINVLLNPSISDEKRAEFAATYWQRVREV